ncbi:Isochorismatase domain-containing protein 1 [Rhizophlyctis rosea]|uniref:Isochorismatase domain-containing protein 1 n=1 Tax=Rhizophlyctis rosea TaxID=64517 RepID=A0AAD5SIX1_9FUNG|nr:Isochorismatase domain-containing protein 1 [Rhizophlyctis rosea]
MFATPIARTAVKVALTNPLPASTAFFLCDLQEKFRSHIFGFPHIVNTASKMIAASKVLGVPLVVSEQNPKALGITVLELDTDCSAVLAMKSKFSMWVPEVQSFVKEKGIKSVVLFGIESHVCITQTALELLSQDYDVIVLADGVSSINPQEVKISLQRLRAAGATVTTSDSILFQLLQDATHEKFKAISGLVKEYKEKTAGALKEFEPHF